jgi:dolichyl-phosphate-mannose--protein O-mannosyl transferase
LIFAYFAPVYLGIVLTYEDWYSRMWLPNWI